MVMTKVTHSTKAGRLLWGNMPLPHDSLLVGTVTRPTGETGALILMPTGRYMQGNAGALRPVNMGVRLTIDDFTNKIVGGESRMNPDKAVWYFIDGEGGNEFYREWEAVTGDFWSDVSDDDLNDSFTEYVNHVLCEGGERHGKA